MKKVILISLMVAGMVSAVFASESLDAESAAMDQALFDSVAGEELSEVDMLAVEGEGYRNAIAFSASFAGTAAAAIFLSAIESEEKISKETIAIYFGIIGLAGAIGWGIGFHQSDSEKPYYRDMGYAWLDDEPWNSWIPIID